MAGDVFFSVNPKLTALFGQISSQFQQ